MRPFSSLTSSEKWLCGLVHSTFVTTPFRVMGLLASNSAPKEWWACAGLAISHTSALSQTPIVYLAIGHLGAQFRFARGQTSKVGTASRKRWRGGHALMA